MFKSMRVDVNTEGVTTCLVPPATPNSIYLTANSNHSQSTFCHVPKIRELSGCNENEALSESDSEGEILEPKRAMSTGTIGSRGSSRKLSAVRAFLHSPTHQAEDKRQLIEESPEEPEPPQAKLSLSFGNVTKKLLELSDSIPRRRSAQENDVQRLLPNGTASIVRTTSF
ncbi:hypothetical protein WR25_17944 [Diploscapter pachys]|uniref:Uncharacterized protein n=1 Tax=Diploscapter pachys TaxID=2018661 RepID=A0A2A2LCR4_9BILA|nr:hypothetical protein WR25_17944 [Diploscapter pachys]